ncbi:MAG: hypothetical protein ABSH11_00760 [Verrucomicrobiota bacterium]|jgi:hypothetical protein
MTYDVSIPGLKRPATELEIWGFVKRELDKLLVALKNHDREEVRRISSSIRSPFEKIQEDMRDDKETKIKQEIAKRRRASDGGDDDEYNTSDDEQSKSHVDAEEIMEVVGESDIAFNEAFPFAAEMLEKLEILSVVQIEEAIKIVTELKNQAV